MPKARPRAVRQYTDEFKLTAVRLSQQPGLLVKTVANALEIHPFMLSKWRKDARDSRLRGRAPKAPPPGPAREIAQLQALEKAHALLQEEHELLKRGSSRITGKRCADFEEEVGIVAIAVGHSVADS
jgi:transposase